MKLYRIHTERFDNLARLAGEYFDGFTIIESVGYWKGQQEKSVIIEVVTENSLYINLLVQDIISVNNQVEVLSYAIEL